MKKANKKLSKVYNLTSRYIDDLISINKPRFKYVLEDIYPEELEKCCVILGSTV